MKKIRGEFITEKDANWAIDKINPYCGHVKIIFDENLNPGYDYYYDDYDYIPDMGVMNFGSFGGLGSFGMTANWGFNSSVLENGHRRAFYHSLPQYNLSGRVVLEAYVADDNYEYVKDKLYSLGAITVT